MAFEILLFVDETSEVLSSCQCWISIVDPVNGRPCTSFSTLLSGKQFSPPWSYRMGGDAFVRIAKSLYCVRPSYRFFYVTVAYFLLENTWFFDDCFRW